MSESTLEETAILNWQNVIEWAEGFGESLAYWNEVTADPDSEEERDHQQSGALAYYIRWQDDRKRRLAEYDARVDDYHAALDEARARVEARDRAEYAALLLRQRPRAA